MAYTVSTAASRVGLTSAIAAPRSKAATSRPSRPLRRPRRCPRCRAASRSRSRVTMSGRPTYQSAPVAKPSTSARSQVSTCVHPRRDAFGTAPVARTAGGTCPARRCAACRVAGPGRLHHGAPASPRPARRTSARRIGGGSVRASVAIHCTFESPAREHGHGPVGVTMLDGPGQRGDRTSVAVHPAQHDDPVPDGRRGPDALPGRDRRRRRRRPAAAGPPAAMHGARAAGPTMSPSTAPASTEASCSGSPTRMQAGVGADRLQEPGHQRERHHGGLVDHDDVMGQAVEPMVAEAGPVAGVEARAAGAASCPAAPAGAPAPPASSAMPATPARTASSSRAAAFPVGAASATSGGRRPAAAAWASSSARTLATVVVFPVPGPPAITDTRRNTAVAAAMRWRSGTSSPSNSSARPDASRSVSTPAAGPSGALEQLGRHLALVGPEAVQVQDRALQVQGAAVPDEPARRPCARTHSAGSGHGSAPMSAGVSVSASAVPRGWSPGPRRRGPGGGRARRRRRRAGPRRRSCRSTAPGAARRGRPRSRGSRPR